jgi:lipoprotein-releasing system permease protein
MSVKLNIEIAKTHLFAKRKQTIIASLGVTFGIAMFIVMISFMTGVNVLLEETSLTNTPHVRIFHDIEVHRKNILDDVYKSKNDLNVVWHQKPKQEQVNIKNGFLISKQIESDPNVLGVSAQIATQVFYNYGPTPIPGMVVGVNILDEDKLYNLKSKMVQGDMESLLTTNDGILLGKGLADKMNLNLGDHVNVTTPQGNTQLMRIVGIFKTNIGAIDNIRSYAAISTVQTLMNKDNRYITDIHVKLKDLSQAKYFAKQYQSQYDYKAEDWEQANATILSSFIIRNVLTMVVVTTLLVVAGFGIYNIMNMTIYDKMKDIAILKATGFEQKDIVQVFLFQAIFIGIMGGVAGLSLGFILSYILSITPFDAGEFLSVETFPVNMDPKFYLFGLVFGVLTTIFAGYFPSRKASKIDPVVILRG